MTKKGLFAMMMMITVIILSLNTSNVLRYFLIEEMDLLSSAIQ
jgi:hypothetical protein